MADHPTPNPLQPAQQAAGAEFIGFGSADTQADSEPAQLVESFGAYQAEYAAIRRRVGILHMPQRGVLRLVGADAADFLHRLVTCDVNGLPNGGSTRGFQLSGKGRIVADFMLHRGDNDTWLETDAMDIPALMELLDSRLFVEDVVMEDWSEHRDKLVLHGPSALALLSTVTDTPEDEDAAARLTNTPGTHGVLRCRGASVTAYRHDDAGAMGLHLLVPTEAVSEVYAALLDTAGFDPQAEAELEDGFAEQRRESLRGRPIGWAAYNTARIETGSPLFHVDFGTDSLPAETALLDRTTSFTKGCYIGQEIVARMHNLGHPKRVLVGLRFDSEALPVAGTQVLEVKDDQPAGAGVVGGITSSTLSPMRGNKAIALAVMKWGRHTDDTAVRVAVEGELIDGVVQKLGFLKA